MMETGRCRHLSLNEFHDRYTALAGGQTLVYAIGEIARAADNYNGAELRQVAGRAWSCSDARNGYLTQKRLGINEFEYRITKPREKGCEE